MKIKALILGLAPALLLIGAAAYAGKYSDTISLFRHAGQSSTFFERSYGYAVFPTVGEGAIGVGGAFGKGQVYVHGHPVGETTMGQVSVGFQAGGKAYSQIIFFEDKRALEEFESGKFEFSAGASAVAITAGASASTATDGSSVGVSGGQKDARDHGVYEKGMAVFTIAKGGLMYAADIAGQKFSYKPFGSGAAQ
jgi:lipid-binding SYLF domain-containing protein